MADAKRMGPLVRLFIRLSLTGLGGPAAHVALMHREVVERRPWLSEAEFLDVVGASSLVPGPTSTEVAMHVGRRRLGLGGLVAAGLSFIVPAAFVVALLAWAYVRFGEVAVVDDLLSGIKPVVVLVVAQAVLQLARTALTSPALIVIGVGVIALYLLGMAEPVVLFVAAAVAAVVARRSTPPKGLSVVVAPGLIPLFLAFLKIGALLFGSGYVLLALLQRELVETHGWLSQAQLLDAVAVGQVTPGPLFTTATFVGYLLAGVPGAVVATVAIFLPSFVLVAVTDPLVRRLRRSATAAAALDGLNAAAVAVMGGVVVQLAGTAVMDVVSAVTAVVAAVVLVRWGPNPTWLIAAGGLVGVAAR